MSHIIDTSASPYRSSSSAVMANHMGYNLEKPHDQYQQQEQQQQPQQSGAALAFPTMLTGIRDPQFNNKNYDSEDDDDSDNHRDDMMSATSNTTGSPENDMQHDSGGISDDDSLDSWGSCSDESDDDEAYFRAAATAHAVQTSRAMARPLSLVEITALANAAGRRGTKPAISVWPRASSMPQMIPAEQVHFQQLNGSETTTADAALVSPSTGAGLGPASSSLMAATAFASSPALSTPSGMKPDEKLQTLWKQRGGSTKYHPYHSLGENFFLPVQPEHIAAFQTNVVQAVRDKDLSAVQALHQRGIKLQCCNKFGESILHMACRQSSPEVLAYLLHTAGLSIRVCCDSGRTPLHDACWSTSPDFDIIILLLEECPDLLKITDKRGFTPLSYVPREKWGEWCDFLEQHKDLVECRELE